MIKPSSLRISLIALVLAALAAVLFVSAQSEKPPAVAPPPPEPPAPSGPVFSGSQLPPQVLDKLIELCGNCRFAASTEQWNATDVHIGDELPDRRFTSIKRVNDQWEIRYERGGFVVSDYTLRLSDALDPQILDGSTCSSAPRYECKW